MPVETATRAVVEAANALVLWRRWYLGLPLDRDIPETLTAALERALAALAEAEAAS